MDDKELLRLIREDPEQGLAQTVRTYGGYVYKIVYTRLSGYHTKEDMEEIVSDVFFKFFQAARRENDIRSVIAYLSAVTQRCCVDVYRQKLREAPQLPLEDVENTALAAEIEFSTSHELAEAIHSLGHPDSDIIIRRFYFGQKNSEIASELNMRTNTVSKRLSRALLRLRKLLEEEM